MLKHPITTLLPPTMDWSFAAPSAVSLPFKIQLCAYVPGLKIVENDGKRRNNRAFVVSTKEFLLST